MATIADIPPPWTLLYDPPPTLDGGPDGRYGSMHFHVPINSSSAFVAALSGTPETLTYPGGTVERLRPLAHPDFADLLVQSYGVDYRGTPGGTGPSIYASMFSHARIRVDFAQLPFDVAPGQPSYALTTDVGVAIETIPGAVFRFSDNSTLSGDAGLPIGVVTFNLTVFMGIGPIPIAILDLVGRLNATSFEGAPPGTVQFLGATSQPGTGMFQGTVQKSYTFRYRPRPWQEVLRWDGVWEAPQLGTTGLLKYQTAEFNNFKYS